MKTRFEKWGGIPRFVLEKTEWRSQHSLQQAIDAANLDAITGYIGQSDISDDASHKLVHMIVETVHPDRAYADVQICLASKFVASQLISMCCSLSCYANWALVRFEALGEHMLQRFLHCSIWKSSLATLQCRKQ